MDEQFRIDELAERAASALVASGTVPPSARVSALPDRRMLRYYTTLGLLDRPLDVRGRAAYYGRRHLLQIVAIKRLQAAGATLAEVQHRLAGASAGELERIADLRPGAGNGAGAVPAAAGRRSSFWRAPSEDEAAPAQEEAPPPAAVVPAAIRLAPGVTLVVDAVRPLSPADHDAIRAAAKNLTDHLSPLLEEPPQ